MLGLAESTLGRTELLELRRRLARCSPGSDGFRPVDLANMLRISVNEMTPVSLPDNRAPAMAEAGTDDPAIVAGTAATGTGEGGAAALDPRTGAPEDGGAVPVKP